MSTRKTLFTIVNSAITTGGSADFGAFITSGYSRLTGLFSTVGSLTFRTRGAVSSGTWLSTSAQAVNSGASNLDVLNFVRVSEFAITAAQSTAYSIVVFGEPTR